MFEINSNSKPSAQSLFRWDLWLFTIVISIGYSTWVILDSLQGGTLALPPTYDDIEYFRDAAYRLHVLKTSGIVGFIEYYFELPPHSPLSTAFAMLGFSVFGLQPWAAVSVNTIFIVLLIRVFLGVTESLPLLIRLALVLSMLLHPYLAVLILNFMPNAPSGLFMAMGCAWIILRPSETRSAFIGGVFFGLALLAKPSVFFLTGLLFGVAFILSSIDAALNQKWQIMFSRAWRLAAATVAVAGLHYVIAATEIWGYVYQTIWGSTSAYWITPMPIYKQLVTYLIGKGGKFGMGWWVYLAPLLLFLYVKVLNVRSFGRVIRDPVVQLTVVAAVTWAFLSFSPIRTLHLGLPVSGFNLVLVGVCVARICDVEKSHALRLAMAMFAIGYVDYMSPWIRKSESEFTTQYAKSRHDVLNELVDKLSALPDIRDSTIILPITSFSINDGILDFSLAQRGIFTKFSGNAFSFDPADYKSKKWNYLVRITGRKQTFNTTIPNYLIIDEIQKVIDQDSTIELIHSIPDPESSGLINIYQKKP